MQTPLLWQQALCSTRPRQWTRWQAARRKGWKGGCCPRLDGGKQGTVVGAESDDLLPPCLQNAYSKARRVEATQMGGGRVRCAFGEAAMLSPDVHAGRDHTRARRERVCVGRSWRWKLSTVRSYQPSWRRPGNRGVPVRQRLPSARPCFVMSKCNKKSCSVSLKDLAFFQKQHFFSEKQNSVGQRQVRKVKSCFPP